MYISVKKMDELTAKELFEIYKVRTRVFVVEQNCPYQEVDDTDIDAYHVVLTDNGEIKRYCRVFEKTDDTAQMGRVLSSERGKNYGAEILKAGISVARDTMKKAHLYIEAQEYAIGFYQREGFVVASNVFLEDGIPHVQMMLDF